MTQLEIFKSGSGKNLVTLNEVSNSMTVEDIKKLISKQIKHLYPDRIALKADPKGKTLSDSTTLKEVSPANGLYLKDLGPQIGWSTVFLCEYAGPLLCYMITYGRPAIIYGPSSAPHHPVVKIAAICWSFHYIKRILETLFVHRFSHATMPIMNIFKNCSYYWGFAFYAGYFINHPLYTPPSLGYLQIYLGFATFVFAELGNFSIHVALRNLRPPGTKERRIPKPTANPFTNLFSLVSCPNYTYEVLAWVSFSFMTQAVPALLFTIAGGGQMLIWALGKHRNYKKEFPNYPRGRKSMIPFVI